MQIASSFLNVLCIALDSLKAHVAMRQELGGNVLLFSMHASVSEGAERLCGNGSKTFGPWVGRA